MSRKRQPLPLGDGSEADAAKMLGIKIEQFRAILPRLQSRDFPFADPDTGKFDLDAINAWRRSRHRKLFPGSPGGEENSVATALEGSEAKEQIRRGLEALSNG